MINFKSEYSMSKLNRLAIFFLNDHLSHPITIKSRKKVALIARIQLFVAFDEKNEYI